MNKSFLKRGSVHLTEVVDSFTGEVLESNEKQHKFLSNTKEEFFIGYVSMLAALRNINWTAIQTYAYILCNYPTTSKIGITSDIKRDILTSIGSKTKSYEVVNRALRDLVDVHFLIKCEGSASTYKINPRYAFKGSTVNRNATLKAILELECPDC